MKKFLVVILVLSCCFAGVTFASAESIKIGLLAPMSGELAIEGQQMKQVVELIAAELNAKGGVLDREVQIVTADDLGEPQAAVDAAKNLLEQNVVAVIGSYSSGVTAAVQEVFSQAKILQITPASTAVVLSEKGINTFFRTCPTDDDEAEAAAELMSDLGTHNVAILHDDSLYSKGLACAARALLLAKNIEITFDQGLQPGKKDYSDVLAGMKKTEPEAVFFTGYYPETAVLLRQKYGMGWPVPFIGGDASHSADLVKLTGVKEAAGFQFLSLPRPENLPSPIAKEFMEKYEKKYGQSVHSIYALLAGDALSVTAFAVAQTQSTDPEKLASYLHDKLRDYHGLTGSISFAKNGDRNAQIFVDYKLDAEGNAELQL